MRRAIVAIAMLAALLPQGSAAASTPDPATLKSALAGAPSSDYVEADPGTKGEGPFDTTTYAAFLTSDTVRQAAIVRTLDADGFAAGFSRVWARTGAGAALIEQILAFKDHSGALNYYGTSKLGDVSASYYRGTIDTSSIPASYGAKEEINGAYTAAVAFVKGNDVFAVGLVSVKDYLESDTISQAQKVYSAAPDFTIQPSAADTVVTNSAAYNLGKMVGSVTVAILVVALAVGLVLAVVRGRRRSSMQAAVPVPAVQMSGDRRFWWDGANWQDANAIAPAHAQRSSDGAFWWDGQAWRPVPR